MQKKFEFTAPSADKAMDAAVQKLHISSDKIYIKGVSYVQEFC